MKTFTTTIQLLGFLLLFAGQSLNAQTTVFGTLVYGDIDESPERGEDGIEESIFDRGLSEGEGIGHVTIELRASGRVYSAVTNSEGTFSIEVPEGKTPQLVYVVAENDYCQVKRGLAITSPKAVFLIAIIDKEEYDHSEIDLDQLEVNDDDHFFRIAGSFSKKLVLLKGTVDGNTNIPRRHPF